MPHKPPFGTYSVSFCPVCIPSFEIAFFFFFPIFGFLWKRYFYWYCEVQLSFQGLSEIKSQSFRKNHKSIFTFYAFKNTYANRQIPAGLHTWIPASLQSNILACLHTWIPAYLHTCILVYLYTCILVYLTACISSCLLTCIPAYLSLFLKENILRYNSIIASYNSPQSAGLNNNTAVWEGSDLFRYIFKINYFITITIKKGPQALSIKTISNNIFAGK